MVDSGDCVAWLIQGTGWHDGSRGLCDMVDPGDCIAWWIQGIVWHGGFRALGGKIQA